MPSTTFEEPTPISQAELEDRIQQQIDRLRVSFSKKPENLEWFNSLDPQDQTYLAQSAQMMDDEFVNEVQAHGGPADANDIDPSKITLRGELGNRAGRYFPQNDVSRNSDKINEKLVARGEEPIPPGNIGIFGGKYMNPQTQAHEYRHLGDDTHEGGSGLIGQMGTEIGNRRLAARHDVIYLMDAFRAQSKEQWKDAVGSFANYKGPRDYEKAEARLKALLELNRDLLVELEIEGGATEEESLDAYERRSRYHQLDFNE